MREYGTLLLQLGRYDAAMPGERKMSDEREGITWGYRGWTGGEGSPKMMQEGDDDDAEQTLVWRQQRRRRRRTNLVANTANNNYAAFHSAAFVLSVCGL